MNLLAGLTVADDVAEEKDIIGGSYQAESGVYDATIEYAYVDKNEHGTTVLHLGAKLHDGFSLNQRINLTKRTGETYYTNKNGEKFPMSGFVIGEAIALFAAQKPLNQLSTKVSVVKLYNKELKKEVPTEVPMLDELIGKTIKIGLKKVIKPSGSYNDAREWVEDQSKTFTFNEIDKVFHPKSGLTVPEIRAKKTEANFLSDWTDKWQGKVDDQTDGTAANTETPAGNVVAASTSSLFK